MKEDGDSLAGKALRRFITAGELTLRHLPIGLSGARVYRCQTAHGQFALKQWPVDTPAQRLDEVHLVQRLASESLAAVPRLLLCDEGQTRLSLAPGMHFELSTWMPGSPFLDPACHPGREGSADLDLADRALLAVRTGAAAIAQFHQATAVLGVHQAVAPAVMQRIERLSQLNSELAMAIPVAQKHGGAIALAAGYWQRHGGRLLSESDSVLRPWVTRPVTTQWVLRDVHRDHLLFKSQQVSGIVDFDAIRRDTKATDLARWVGSFAELRMDRDKLWDAAFSGYSDVLVISACEQALSRDIERASWCIHLANWVVWSGAGLEKIPGGIAAANRRVAWLLRRSGVRLEI